MASGAMDNTAVKAGSLRWTSHIVKWLVEPSAAVDEKKRRHLRLLTAFLLLMAVNTFIGVLMIGEEEGRPFMLAAACILFFGYVLSRTRYFSLGVFIAVSVPAVPIVALILFSQEREQIALQLPWLALPLLICSLLLSLHITIIIASVYVAFVFGLTFLTGIPAPNAAESLAYILMIIFFVVAITAARQRDQRELEHQLRQREQAEQALRESEEKFSSAFKTNPNAICIVSVADGNFTEVNESFCRFTAYPHEEIIGRSPIDLNLFVNQEELNRMATGLQENGRVDNREFQSRRKSGEVRLGLFYAEVINIGSKPCVILVITDITERKRAEQLQKDENHVLMLLSQGAELQDVLEAILRMGELRDPSIRGSVLLVDPVKKVLAQAGGPSLSEEFKQLLANGLPIGEGFGACGTAAFRKKRVIVPDMGNNPLFGDSHVIEVTRRNAMLSCWSQPIISSTGELFGTIANYGSRVGEPDEQNLAVLEWSARIVAIAIERKRAEEALKESEEKFSKAFHASPDIIIISRTRDHRFIEVNDSFTRLTGFTREQILGDPSIEYRLMGDLPDRERIVKLLNDRGSVRNQEVGFRIKKGEDHTMLFSSEPINFGGEPCKITIAKDITDLKRAEEELKQAMARLEKSSAQLQATNRELETFSYSVSHDLRSPLRSIDGFSQALIEDYQERFDERGKDYLNRLRLASQKMGALIDGLLKLSRLTRNEMHQETVDLAVLANEIVVRLQETQPEHKVEFIAGDNLNARGDPQLLRVLLENLVGNAWKFSGKNPQARIEFGNVRHNGKTEFFIRDNGVGFDMSFAGKLFGAFQRLHNAEDFPGTGIGLATVQRIINRHGGTIRAEGEVGKGATFYFTLS
jgi:PAS domain S-box-containing protein